MSQESMLEEIAKASNPSHDLPISERRKRVASTICQMIDADIWLWFTGVINTEVNGDSMVTSFVDGGFENEAERAEFFRIIIHPELVSIATKPLSEAIASKRTITRRREQLLADEIFDASPLSIIWKQLGFADFIISAFPVGLSGYSALGFHRRVKRPRFTHDETFLVSVVSHCLSWLHLAVPPTQASELALQLSPRERQVVMFLISGNSKKQVATKIGISEHTVNDYIKEIYSKFSVNSRAELLSKFISGLA